MKVAVYGAGGVGGFFGGRLARSGADVRFIARGSHLQALQAQGLRVASVHGGFELARVTAADDPAKVGPVDYVLVTVKSYHTAQVATRLRPLLHQDTAVISLQNGVDNEEKLAAVVGEDRVVGGAAYIFCTMPDRHLAFADGLEPGGYSSLHHDLTHGHPMELEALLGEAIRRGARAGVATPMSQALYAVLQPWQLRNQQ